MQYTTVNQLTRSHMIYNTSDDEQDQSLAVNKKIYVDLTATCYRKKRTHNFSRPLCAAQHKHTQSASQGARASSSLSHTMINNPILSNLPTPLIHLPPPLFSHWGAQVCEQKTNVRALPIHIAFDHICLASIEHVRILVPCNNTQG